MTVVAEEVLVGGEVHPEGVEQDEVVVEVENLVQEEERGL